MTKEHRPKHPPPFLAAAIEEYTQLLRILLGVEDQPRFNIIPVIENGLMKYLKNFSLEIWSQEALGKVHAFTAFGPARMVVREDVYEAAYKDEARARFTIAHELGHLCLHWGYPRPRQAPEFQNIGRSPIVNRIENEANHFAGAFLMPKFVAHQLADPDRLAQRCCVSNLAATKRLDDLLRRGDALNATTVRTLFGSARGKKP